MSCIDEDDRYIAQFCQGRTTLEIKSDAVLGSFWKSSNQKSNLKLFLQPLTLAYYRLGIKAQRRNSFLSRHGRI